MIPLKIYFKDSLVKIEMGIAKGKKLYDKRVSATHQNTFDRYQILQYRLSTKREIRNSCSVAIRPPSSAATHFQRMEVLLRRAAFETVSKFHLQMFKTFILELLTFDI